MKSAFKVFASFGLFGVVAGVLCLIFAPLALSIYGLVLAFKASIVLGVIAMLVEPSPFVLGILGVFGHPEVAQKIATWMGLS